MSIPKHTPWGRTEHAQELAPGIWSVSTASHGGFYLDSRALDRIPQNHQAYAAQWSHGRGPNWFEEDVAACAVIAAYPELFLEHVVQAAKEVAARYIDRAAQ